MQLRLIFLATTAAFTLSNLCLAEDKLAAHYFGHIEAACKDSDSKCLHDSQGRSLLDRIDTECTQIEDTRGCSAGTELLKKIFGYTYRAALPDYLVYLQQKEVDGKTHFLAHTPVLIWKGKNTPYVYGARDIFAIVITEKKVCLSASVHTDYRIDPNPFIAIASALGAKFDTQQPRPSEDNTAQFRWYPLSGRETTPLWLAIGRIAVDVNSVNRITVQYTQPKKPSGSSDGPTKSAAARPQGSATTGSSAPGSSGSGPSSSGADRGSSGAGKDSGADTGDQPIECTNTDRVVISDTSETREETQPLDKTTQDDKTKEKTKTTKKVEKVTTQEKVITQDNLQYSGDFLAANGFFSDSPDDYFAISFALGLTAPASGTSVASGGSNVAFNGYLLAKVYLEKPKLRAGPDSYLQGYTRSFALFVGSNVAHSAFNELIAGLSIGNLMGGRGGLLVGINSVAGATGSQEGRKIRPFIGLEYTF